MGLILQTTNANKENFGKNMFFLAWISRARRRPFHDQKTLSNKILYIYKKQNTDNSTCQKLKT